MLLALSLDTFLIPIRVDSAMYFDKDIYNAFNMIE